MEFSTHFLDNLVIQVTESPDPSKFFLGSPSLVRLEDGVTLVSHDVFSWDTDPTMFAKTFVYAVKEDKVTLRCTVDGLFWANMFLLEDALYLFGTSQPHGAIVLMRSTDGGYHFTRPTNSQNGLLFPLGGEPTTGRRGLLAYHCAPVPVAFHHGRIYRAFERKSTFAFFPGLFSFVISAPLHCDLLDADNWIKSQESQREDCLEGNAIAHTDGRVYNLLRMHRTNTAALYSLGENYQDYHHLQDVYMPGGDVKFTVRFDEVSRKYIAITNFHTDSGAESNLQRNVLGLTYSENLLDWQQGHIIIQEIISEDWNHSLKKIGFQYVDWIFDQDDLLMAIRTSYQGADTFHNANRITLHRLKCFRQYLQPRTEVCDYQFAGNLLDSSKAGNHLRQKAGTSGGCQFDQQRGGICLQGGYLDAHYLLGNGVAGFCNIHIQMEICLLPGLRANNREYLFSLASGPMPGLTIWLSHKSGRHTLFVHAASTPLESGVLCHALLSAEQLNSPLHFDVCVDYEKGDIRIFINGQDSTFHQTGHFNYPAFLRSGPDHTDKIGADIQGKNTLYACIRRFSISGSLGEGGK